MHPEREHTYVLFALKNIVNHTRGYENTEIKLSKIPPTVLKMHTLNFWMENKLWAFRKDVLSKVINIVYIRNREFCPRKF